MKILDGKVCSTFLLSSPSFQKTTTYSLGGPPSAGWDHLTSTCWSATRVADWFLTWPGTSRWEPTWTSALTHGPSVSRPLTLSRVTLNLIGFPVGSLVTAIWILDDWSPWWNTVLPLEGLLKRYQTFFSFWSPVLCFNFSQFKCFGQTLSWRSFQKVDFPRRPSIEQLSQTRNPEFGSNQFQQIDDPIRFDNFAVWTQLTPFQCHLQLWKNSASVYYQAQHDLKCFLWKYHIKYQIELNTL